MNITEIRIKLVQVSEKEKETNHLRAFCSVTMDQELVIRDLKIIEGARGLHVAMPSRKLMDRCAHCGGKNHLRARFCNNCGNRLDEDRSEKNEQGRHILHANIAHPINADMRQYMQHAIIEEYLREQERAKKPGYVCRYRPSGTEEEETDVPEAA